MIKPGRRNRKRAANGFSFDFEGRNRRPPRDPVNALLSLAYSMLAKDLTIACYAVGFDPYMGFYHQLRHGRPAFGSGFDGAIPAADCGFGGVERGEYADGDGEGFRACGRVGGADGGGTEGFFRAYELRMDTLVTHPLFEYRVSYRRLLEIQARLLARVIEGEIAAYPVFVTR